MNSLYDQAMEAINKVFFDRGVPASETLSNLKALDDLIQIMIEALESDLEDE